MSASSTALPNACWPWTTIRIVNSLPYVSRAQHSAKRCAADPGSSFLAGPRVCGAPQARCTASGARELLSRFLFLLRRRQGAGILDLGDILGRELEHVLQNLVGMLAKQRRAFHVRNRVRQLDR